MDKTATSALIPVRRKIDLLGKRHQISHVCPREEDVVCVLSRWGQFEGCSRQRVTTTEAEDAAGMSKRKRKLRKCDKCDYVTDNMTTLQRNDKKHGAGGTYKCERCDYR